MLWLMKLYIIDAELYASVEEVPDEQAGSTI